MEWIRQATLRIAINPGPGTIIQSGTSLFTPRSINRGFRMPIWKVLFIPWTPMTQCVQQGTRCLRIIGCGPFESEADCELWFHSEISNVVLTSQFPVVTQSSHIKPPRVDNISEEIDAVYSVKFNQVRTVLAKGEMKRNLIQAHFWQYGNISLNRVQKRLLQELRGCVTSESWSSLLG